MLCNVNEWHIFMIGNINHPNLDSSKSMNFKTRTEYNYAWNLIKTLLIHGFSHIPLTNFLNEKNTNLCKNNSSQFQSFSEMP